MDPRAGLDECEKSRLTGIGSPDLAASKQSLYRLRYPGPQDFKLINKINTSLNALYLN